MVPRENKRNTYAKFWRNKQRVLWYFFKLAYKSQNLCLGAGQNDRSSEVECTLKKPTDFRDHVSSFKFHNC